MPSKLGRHYFYQLKIQYFICVGKFGVIAILQTPSLTQKKRPSLRINTLSTSLEETTCSPSRVIIKAL